MDGTGKLFAPLIAALGARLDTQVVSYPTSEALGYAELTEFARASLPTRDEFVILGESFSGPIAIALAASSPRNLKGLILCCSFVRNPRPALFGFRGLIGLVRFKQIPASIVNFFVLGGFITPDLRSAFAQALSPVTSNALRARLKGVVSVNVSSKLSGVTVPVLCLSSLRDRLVPKSASTEISRLLSTAKVVFVDAPHSMLQATPERAAREIKSFLRDIDAKAA